ncbi:type II toxin-antitoxin system VapC family toxin [Rhizobium sp.]
MILLLDTHILLWMSIDQDRLSRNALQLLGDEENEIWFSAISILEMAIKQGLGKLDLRVPVDVYRTAMLAKGFNELPVRGEQAAYVARLPQLHKDPFDRLLVAQATVEGMLFLTADELLAQYPGPILKV